MNRMTIDEFMQQEGMESFEDLYDSITNIWSPNAVYPALCTEGCEVEPDGTCPHGNPSIALELGLL